VTHNLQSQCSAHARRGNRTHLLTVLVDVCTRLDQRFRDFTVALLDSQVDERNTVLQSHEQVRGQCECRESKYTVAVERTHNI
jgi:hypothetical protein